MKEPESETAPGSGQNKDFIPEIAGQSGRNALAWRKWSSPRRWPFWVLTLLLAYTLGGFFGLPWLLERVATQQVAELDRKLSFGEIKVNPFLLTLQMKDVELRDNDDALLFSYVDYFLNLQASGLFRWAWTFKEIRLDGLQLNWERFAPGDDRFGRLIDSFPVEEEPKPEVPAPGLPRLIVQKFQISEANILLTDHLKHGKFDIGLGPINFAVTNLSTLPDESGQQLAHVKTRSGGEIAWQGSLQLSPLSSSGSVTVKGRLLSDLDHYLALFTSAKLTGEDLEWGFNYRVEQTADKSFSASVEGLNARFDDWKLFLPNETEPFLDLPRIEIKGANLHYPQLTLDIEGIELQEAGLNLATAADGSLNLDSLLEELAGNTAETGDSTAVGNNAQLQASIGQFSIKESVVRYKDSTKEPAVELGMRDINLSVSNINNQSESSFLVQAGFNLESGGSGQFDGQVVVLPLLSAGGQFSLDGMQLPVFQPWVSDLANLTVNSGSLSLGGEVQTSPEQPGSFVGSVAVKDLDVNDNIHREKLAGWQELLIDRVEADLAANTVKTSDLRFNKLYGRLRIGKNQTTNLDGLMVEAVTGDAGVDSSSEAAAKEEAQPSVGLAITVSGMQIDDASFDFSDLSLPLPFSAAIRSMDGKISTLATNSEEPARVELEGQVNEFGLARIGGSLNAWDPVGFTDIQMTFRNLEMERMTPYTIEFAGWEIDAGRMDLELDYKIKAGQLDGANDIVIRELTVGDKAESSSGASLPLKLAVALLKDSEGVIDVDLPVEGDLNDPSFKIGGVVWKAIGNLLVKAVTAPFRLLGSLVGVDSEDFGQLHFVAGQSEISPPDREQLLKLADAMRLRPELRLEVAGTYAAEVDKLALQTFGADQSIEAAVKALPASADGIETDQRRQVMEQMLAASVDVDLLVLQQQHSAVPEGEDPEKAQPVLDETAYLETLRQKLIAATPVGEAELQSLAESRASVVMTALASSESDQPLSVEQLAAIAVEPDENSEVPLELKVEAAAE